MNVIRLYECDIAVLIYTNSLNVLLMHTHSNHCYVLCARGCDKQFPEWLCCDRRDDLISEYMRHVSHMNRSYHTRTCSVCCSVLHCVAVCCSVLQCVAVCCSVSHMNRAYHTRTHTHPRIRNHTRMYMQRTPKTATYTRNACNVYMGSLHLVGYIK